MLICPSESHSKNRGKEDISVVQGVSKPLRRCDSQSRALKDEKEEGNTEVSLWFIPLLAWNWKDGEAPTIR